MYKKINVLHFVTKLNTGGIETWLNNVHSEINKNEFKMDFIVFSNGIGTYNKEVEKRGGQIFCLKSHKNIYNNFKYLSKIVKKNNYQIFHLHLYKYNAIYAILGKLIGVKIISHSHNKGFDNQMISINTWPNNIYKFIQKNISDYKLGCSKDATLAMFDKFNEKTKVLNYGIAPEKFCPKEEKNLQLINKYAENKIIIGHVGRFVEVKNHKFIINLAYEIEKKHPNKYKFLLIGDGVLKSKISDQIKKFNLSKVVFIIDATPDVYKYFTSVLDIFILPSFAEGLGIVALEAQATGLTTIVSKGVPDDVRVLKEDFKVADINNMNAWIDIITKDNNFSYYKRKFNHMQFLQSQFTLKNSTRTLEKTYKECLNINQNE